jgi:hypothetical protein
VLAGLIAGVVLSLGTDELLHVAGIFPSLGEHFNDRLLLIATAHRTVYNVAGSYIAARLAPYRPMLHALVGGAIGLVLATAGAVATWTNEAKFGPHWYPVALIVLAMPCAWLGGWIELKMGKR